MKDLTLFIIVFVILFSFALTGGSSFEEFSQSSTPAPTTDQERYTFSPQEPTPQAGANLQIRTPVFTNGSPAPTQTACSVDKGTICSNQQGCNLYWVTCVNHRCTNVEYGPGVKEGTDHPFIDCNYINNVGDHTDPATGIKYTGWCNAPDLVPDPQGNTHPATCMGKPVIYLYPTQPTLVDVSLSIPGEIIVSIPQYPEGGWQDVLAHPDGRLEYQGKEYKELFYESEVGQVLPPTSGIIIPKSTLTKDLSEILFKLGLNESEKQEFMEFWIPQLHALNSNYIQFSVYDPLTKETVDGVHVSPEPDTRIEILGYFKALSHPVVLEPLILPDSPPKRIGFTMVEWGATIDTNPSIVF